MENSGETDSDAVDADADASKDNAESTDSALNTEGTKENEAQADQTVWFINLHTVKKLKITRLAHVSNSSKTQVLTPLGFFDLKRI